MTHVSRSQNCSFLCEFVGFGGVLKFCVVLSKRTLSIEVGVACMLLMAIALNPYVAMWCISVRTVQTFPRHSAVGDLTISLNRPCKLQPHLTCAPSRSLTRDHSKVGDPEGNPRPTPARWSSGYLPEIPKTKLNPDKIQQVPKIPTAGQRGPYSPEGGSPASKQRVSTHNHPSS